MTQKAKIFCLIGLCSMIALGMTDAIAANETNVAKAKPTVTAVPVNRIKAISAKIDELVEAKIASAGQSPNPDASDEIFLRRIYLDIAGRIPTFEESESFLNSRAANKRSQLIDELLDSDAYVSNMFNFFADLLRVQSRLRQGNGAGYVQYVKESLAENKPYNVFVHEMLSSEGPVFQPGNGQVNYFLRDFGMPEDNMSNTVRVFLGTRLECAQCHDHPFDKWTQKQYFEMVAFTGGLSFRLNQPDSEYPDQIKALARDRSIPEEARQFLRNLIRPMTYGVTGGGTGLARLPEGYAYEDGKEYDIVTNKTMFERKSLVEAEVPKPKSSKRKQRQRKVNKRNLHSIPGAKDLQSREAYSKWLTSADNPRFSQVISNRLWKRAMGLGLVEPVDILEDDTTASNPELLDYLTTQMVALDFDMKQFLRAVYNSNTYQRTGTSEDILEADKFNFNGPVVRRMRAEQLWDTLLTLAVADVDDRKSSGATNIRYVPGGSLSGYAKLRSMTAEQIKTVALDMAKLGRKEAYKKLQKMMSMDNSMAMEKEKTKARSKAKNFQRELAKLSKQAKAANRKGDRDLAKELYQKQQEMKVEYQVNQRRSDLMRASELSSPARPGHMLRQFGQSDREQIENSNMDPSVTQVLALMNGFIETKIARNRYTVLMQNVNRAKSAEDKIKTTFLTMLSREPSEQELKVWLEDFQSVKTAQSDLIWTLANTNEFLFVR